MFDHGPSRGEPVQVAGLGQDRRGPDRGQPVDGASQLGQPELIQDGDHACLGVGQLGPGVVPVLDDPGDPFERGRPVRQHPGRVGQGGEHLPHDPQAGTLPAAAGDLFSDGSFEPGRPEASGAVQVAAVTVDDHGHRGHPGRRAERSVRSFQRGGPHALEQVADLLDACHVLTGELFAAGAEVPQPRPCLVDRFGQVAAQFRDQAGDQDGVLVVGLCPG